MLINIILLENFLFLFFNNNIMNDSLNMYDDFSNVVSNEECISTEAVLNILKNIPEIFQYLI